MAAALEVHGVLSGNFASSSVTLSFASWAFGVENLSQEAATGHHRHSCAIDQHPRVICPCPQAGGFCRLSSSMVTVSL